MFVPVGEESQPLGVVASGGDCGGGTRAPVGSCGCGSRSLSSGSDLRADTSGARSNSSLRERVGKRERGLKSEK